MIPDPQDPRDFIFGVPPWTAYHPALAVDHSALCLPVEDQSSSLVCTAAATAEGCEMFSGEELGWQPVYDEMRALFGADGGVFDGAGGSLRWALKAARSLGSLDSYARIAETGLERVRAIRYALARGLPVVICLRVGSQFAGLQAGQIYPPISTSNPFAYNHAMLLVGYQAGMVEWFKVKNSYGDHWADNGYGLLNAVAVMNDSVDVWVLEGAAGKTEIAPDRNRRSEAWEWCVANLPDVRAWVNARFYLEDNPQAVIDKAVEIGVTPAELEVWMDWGTGAIADYASSRTDLDWSRWL